MAIASSNSQGAGGSKKAPVRVSQATIDKIKTMGMTKALSGAKSASPEMKEALTRMYGAARVAKAAGPVKSAAATYKKNNMPAYRPATAGTTNSVAKKAAPKPTPAKPKRDSGLAQVTRGVSRIINSSPGANLGSKFSNKNLTPAQKEAARKAAAAATKRAGGRQA